MYGGEPATVLLRFKKELLTQFYDRFEQTVTVFEDPKDKDYLQANVTVHVAPTFFSWVFQYNGGFSIVGPKGFKEKYEDSEHEPLMTKTGREWLLDAIALQWKHVF